MDAATIQLSSRNRRGFFVPFDDFIFQRVKMHPFS